MRSALAIAALVVGCGARPAASAADQGAVPESEFVASHSVAYAGESRGRVRVRVVGADVGKAIRTLAVTGDAVTDDALNRDDVTLTEWLLDRGHVEGTVAHSAEILPDEVAVTYTLAPGPVYTLRSFDVGEATPSGKQPALGWVAPFKDGEVFNRASLVRALAAVRLAYRDLGYANVEADADANVDRDKHNVAIKIAVIRNEVVFFEKVNVAGNKSVALETIRGELAVKDGERFSETALESSKRALEKTGLFEKVNVSVATGSDKTRVVVQFVVEERAAK